MLGIITFQTTNNFGAFLHTIALYRKVRELGCECEILDYQCPSLIAREKPIAFSSLSLKAILAYFLYMRKRINKYNTLYKELREYTQLSSIYTPATIAKANDKYSGFMVGSDVVWSLRITDNDYNYFLEFAAEHKAKLAFSSSVGECEKYRNDKQLPYLLRRFNGIAVRDEEAVEWVKTISDVDAQYVCDPTMLYEAAEWDVLIRPTEYIENYVLVYFGDEKIISDAKTYAAKYQLKVKIINYGLPICGVENVSPNSLKEFVGLIKHSCMMCTASYHGMLYALYYNKEFLYYNRGLKARMASLARMLDIESCCGDNTKVEVYKSIDYARVNKRMDEFRNYSLEILKNMLNTL